MRSLFILLACVYVAIAENVCGQLGQECDRTVFNRCCDGLYCVLSSPGHGTCQSCLPGGHFCFRNAECCSGGCAWYFFCK